MNSKGKIKDKKWENIMDTCSKQLISFKMAIIYKTGSLFIKDVSKYQFILTLQACSQWRVLQMTLKVGKDF